MIAHLTHLSLPENLGGQSGAERATEPVAASPFASFQVGLNSRSITSHHIHIKSTSGIITKVSRAQDLLPTSTYPHVRAAAASLRPTPISLLRRLSRMPPAASRPSINFLPPSVPTARMPRARGIKSPHASRRCHACSSPCMHACHACHALSLATPRPTGSRPTDTVAGRPGWRSPSRAATPQPTAPVQVVKCS